MSRKRRLAACLDSNVFISAIAFRGLPYRLLERALRRDFHLITSVVILEEVRRNLIGKLEVSPHTVDPLLEDILAVASAFVSSGKHHYIDHKVAIFSLSLKINRRFVLEPNCVSQIGLDGGDGFR